HLHFLNVVSTTGSQSFVALPLAPGHSIEIWIDSLSAVNPTVDLHIDDLDADLLLSGLQRGYLAQSAVIADSSRFSPERMEILLREKVNDPIGAAVGAYAI